MDDTVFRGKIERYHKQWLGNALWVPGNGHLGIDLLSYTDLYEDASYSEDFAIEFKSKMVRYPQQFAVNADQVNDFPKEYPGRDFYWAFMSYSFSKKVKEVSDTEDLEALVTQREVWCMPWNWIRKFPISKPKKSGPFRYVPKKTLPNPNKMTIFEEEKGRIYVQKNSTLESHLINRALILGEEEKYFEKDS